MQAPTRKGANALCEGGVVVALALGLPAISSGMCWGCAMALSHAGHFLLKGGSNWRVGCRCTAATCLDSSGAWHAPRAAGHELPGFSQTGNLTTEATLLKESEQAALQLQLLSLDEGEQDKQEVAMRAC